MQITIDTDRDDLLAVIHMLRELSGYAAGPSGATPELERLAEIDEEILAEEIFNDEALADAIKTAGPDTHKVYKPVPPPSLFDAPKSHVATATEAAYTTELTASPATALPPNGVPWDERIHASTKTKTADGNYKYKRGVDKAYVAQVEKELRGEQSSVPVINSGEISGGGGNAAGAVPPPPPPPPSGQPQLMSYQELIAKVMSSGGHVTPQHLGEACKAEGVESFPALGDHPDKVPAVAKRLGLA